MPEQEIVCSCGAAVRHGARFCRICGTAVPAQIASLSEALISEFATAGSDSGERSASGITASDMTATSGLALPPPTGSPITIEFSEAHQVLSPPDASTLVVAAVTARSAVVPPAIDLPPPPPPPTVAELEARRSLHDLTGTHPAATGNGTAEQIAQSRSRHAIYSQRLGSARTAVLASLRRPRTWIAAAVVCVIATGAVFGYRWISDPRRSDIYQDLAIRVEELRAEQESLRAELVTTADEEAVAAELRNRVAAAREARETLLDEIEDLVRSAQTAKDATVRLEATLERYRRGDFD